MRFRRLLLVPTLALAAHAGLWSEEPVPGTTVGTFALADGKDLIAHWEQGPWGKTWAEPALAPLHAPVDAWQQESAKTLDGTPLELLAAMRQAGGLLKFGTVANRPAFVAGADFGAFASKLFALAKKADQGAAEVQIAGADAAFRNPKENQKNNVLARFATALVAGINTPPVKPEARTTPLAGDVIAQANFPALMRLILQAVDQQGTKSRLAEMDAQFARNGITDATYRMDLVPEGFLEHIAITAKVMNGYRAVDRDLLARLPASTLMAVGVGFDGAAVWKTERSSLLSGWAPLVGTDPTNLDATEQALDQVVAKFGIPIKISDLMTGMVGTSVFAITPGMPFPALSLSLPRSPALDQAVIALLAKIEAKAPEEGSSIPLPLPGVPVALTLVREAKSWFITSDLTAADSWLVAKPGGWADTPAMKLALSKASPDAYVIGASDTPAVLRLIAGYAGMALGMAKDMPADQKQALLQGLNLLASHAATGYVVAGRQDGQIVTEVRSITGLVAGPLTIGAAAGVIAARRAATITKSAPGMGHATAPKRGPAQILRSVVFPAEVQFQAGGYIDQNGNGIGEYGLLSELSGRRPVNANNPTIALLDGPLAKGAVADGYAYAVYLPATNGRVAEDGKKEVRAAIAANAELQEHAFVAYAWPVRVKTGKMYALTADGAVYEADFAGQPPAWNAVFGGKGWQDAPTWKPAGTGSSVETPAPAEPAAIP
jgi:hypothetical protein